jgi:hypothetical protein
LFNNYFSEGFSVDAIADALGNPLVLAGMGLALVALIGVMIYLRSKKNDDE